MALFKCFPGFLILAAGLPAGLAISEISKSVLRQASIPAVSKLILRPLGNSQLSRPCPRYQVPPNSYRKRPRRLRNPAFQSTGPIGPVVVPYYPLTK